MAAIYHDCYLDAAPYEYRITPGALAPGGLDAGPASVHMHPGRGGVLVSLGIVLVCGPRLAQGHLDFSVCVAPNIHV